MPTQKDMADLFKTGILNLVICFPVLMRYRRQKVTPRLWTGQRRHNKEVSLSSFTHPNLQPYPSLDHESLNLVLDGPDLAHEITSLVGGDTGRDHRTRHTSGPTQGKLAGDVDVGDVLVLSQEGQVEQDGERGGVRGQDDNLSGSTIKSLGRCWVERRIVSERVLHEDQNCRRRKYYSPSLAPFFNWR